MTFLILSTLAWAFILYLSIYAWRDVIYSYVLKDFDTWGLGEGIATAILIIFPLLYGVLLGLKWYALLQS